MSEPSTRPSARARRRAAAVLIASGALIVPALPAAAWTGPITDPAPPGTSGPQPSLQVTPDGSALLLGEDPDDPAAERARLVRLSANGTAGLAPAFPAEFGEDHDASADDVVVSEPDRTGAVLVHHRGTHKYLHLAKGQDPATATVLSAPDRIQHLDVNPSGAAAAIVGGGSTVAVYRRAAGASAPWVKVATTAPDDDLDRLGQERSYGVGVTVDPDGGIYVVYETEQSASVLQAYAPPGGSFGAPSVLAHDLDPDSLSYAQSTNGHVALGWEVPRTSSPFVADRVVVAVRRPGTSKAGTPSTLATEPSGSGTRVVLLLALGITDSGRVYAGQRDAQRVSGCDTNIHGDVKEYLATGLPGGSWIKQQLPGTTWDRSTTVAGIATGGDHARIVTIATRTTGTRCLPGLPTDQALSVRTPVGTAFGSVKELVPFTRINPGTVDLPMSAPGLAVGANGHAAMLVSRPDGEERAHDLFVDGAPSRPKVRPKAGTVTVAKSQKLKKNKVRATVACARAGESAAASCTVNVKVKVKAKKGKKFKAAGKTRTKVAAGKKKAVKVTLRKKARQQVRATKKRTRIRFVVTVTKKDATTVKVTRTKKVRR